MLDSEPRLLVRVKRRRDEEPLPEILVEDPAPRADSAAKRLRPDAAAAALRLVDSVGSRQWPDEEDALPASWLRAAAHSTGSTSSVGGTFWQKLNALPELHEAGRRLVGGSTGEAVQLIDVERPGGREASGPQLLTGFTIDGVEMFASPCGPPSSGEDADMEDFVWDVYTLSDDPPASAASASVRLLEPMFGMDENATALEDLEDIDDSQSSSEEGDSRFGGGWRAGSSSEDEMGLHEPEDRSKLDTWIDAMD
eukprot:TRINITY_DN47710_c0_g1_i1.p1 TRINITY_DN47710_c0_g1~~TRINITY_DN47710_c0_g1_i1.p1  ORF type:complete len:253 (+),score=64.25 TRINITY_DN47710_c0_g1_i1:70-828(+)